MKKRGWTLIELLAVIFVITVALGIGKSVTRSYGTWVGVPTGLFAGLMSTCLVALFYYWMGQRDERRRQVLRDKYRGIYRVISIPPDPRIIAMPKGAEIRIGDYGWEAGPSRKDGLIYLQGLTADWTIVWHVGFRPDQVELIASKPFSQYDSWHPYWAPPPALPPCPFPVIERETMTVGRPHHSHWYVESPRLFRFRSSSARDQEVAEKSTDRITGNNS